MARPVKHTVKLDDKVIGTRKSPRTYTHAIIGHRDLETDLASALRRAERDVATNWSHYVQEANPDTNRYGRQAYYAKLIEGGREAYLESLRAQLRAQVEGGNYGYGVLQWSMSEANARKAAGTWSKNNWFDVRVVPVDRAE